GHAATPHVQRSLVPAPKPPPLPASTKAWERQRDTWLSLLSQKTFAAWPREELPLGLQERFSATRHGVRLQAFDFGSQPNVRLRLYLLQRSSLSKPAGVELTVLGTTNAVATAAEDSTACPTYEQ